MDIVTRGCKNLESTAPLLRLKKDLFCDYDTSIRPDHHKTVTNVTVKLMPKLMEFVSTSSQKIAYILWRTDLYSDDHEIR